MTGPSELPAVRAAGHVTTLNLKFNATPNGPLFFGAVPIKSGNMPNLECYLAVTPLLVGFLGDIEQFSLGGHNFLIIEQNWMKF